MMYRTELVEGITVENVTEKINAKIEEITFKYIRKKNDAIPYIVKGFISQFTIHVTNKPFGFPLRVQNCRLMILYE